LVGSVDSSKLPDGPRTQIALIAAALRMTAVGAWERPSRDSIAIEPLVASTVSKTSHAAWRQIHLDINKNDNNL
jgi:hypothetical protein